jgi:hypothetical protein
MPKEEVYDPEDWFTKGLGDENKDEAEDEAEVDEEDEDAWMHDMLAQPQMAEERNDEGYWNPEDMKEAAKWSRGDHRRGEEDKDPLRIERAQGMVRQDAAKLVKTRCSQKGENKQHNFFLFFAMDILQG